MDLSKLSTWELIKMKTQINYILCTRADFWIYFAIAIIVIVVIAALIYWVKEN